MSKGLHILLPLTGSDFQAIEVQHRISHQDRCGACQPVRAAQNVGRTEEGQQELSLSHHKGQSVNTQVEM